MLQWGALGATWKALCFCPLLSLFHPSLVPLLHRWESSDGRGPDKWRGEWAAGAGEGSSAHRPGQGLDPGHLDHCLPEQRGCRGCCLNQVCLLFVNIIIFIILNLSTPLSKSFLTCLENIEISGGLLVTFGLLYWTQQYVAYHMFRFDRLGQIRTL